MGLARRGWLHACSKARTSVSPGFFPHRGGGLYPAGQDTSLSQVLVRLRLCAQGIWGE